MNKLYLSKKKKVKLQFILFFTFHIILLFSGYIFSANFIAKPISQNDIIYYEQIATNIYQSGNENSYTVPNDVILKRTNSKIILSSTKINTYGKVIATVKNNNLHFEHDRDIATCIALNFAFGYVVSCLSYMTFTVILTNPNKKVKV